MGVSSIKKQQQKKTPTEQWNKSCLFRNIGICFIMKKLPSYVGILVSREIRIDPEKNQPIFTECNFATEAHDRFVGPPREIAF